MGIFSWKKTLLLSALMALAGNPSTAAADDNGLDDDDILSFHYMQKGFDGHGRVKVRFWGRDLNGDGVLYSMSGFMANFLPFLDPASNGAPLPVGNEVIRVEVTYIGFFGLPNFTQVFDERETPIDLTPAFGPTAFYGFVYNLDGGELGDDPNEGFSLSPLAPSVSYVTGELFKNLLFDPAPDLVTCGQGGDTVCAAVQQFGLGPFGPVVLNEGFSNRRARVHERDDDDSDSDD